MAATVFQKVLSGIFENARQRHQPPEGLPAKSCRSAPEGDWFIGRCSDAVTHFSPRAAAKKRSETPGAFR
jgi:hypothetical protein